MYGLEEALDLARADVHKDKMTQEAKKKKASHAVKRLSTSAVAVPKTDSLASPPNEAPKPVLLLS